MKLKQRTILIGLFFFLCACRGEATAPPAAGSAATAVREDGAASEAVTPSGTVYFIESDATGQALAAYDVVSETTKVLFSVPENGWLVSFDLAAEGNEFVLAYAPPPAAGQIQFGFSQLYLMPVETNAEQRLLIEPGSTQDVFFNPVWAPDGTYIYYSHVTPADEEARTFVTMLKRIQLETGDIEIIAENAIWPGLSPDGSKLAFIVFDPQTQANTLVVAEADGQARMELLTPADFVAMDAPVFSPDGQSLYFSGVLEDPAARTWWEVVLGIETVAAHNLPSDWYRVPVSGGEPDRLTEIEAIGLYGRFAPEAAPFFAFASQNGLFMMDLDGANLRRVLDSPLAASLAWISE